MTAFPHVSRLAMLALGIWALALMAWPLTSAAQSPAASPLTLVVGSQPGSLTDVAASLVARSLRARGRGVEVVHRPEDGGREAARFVVQSVADPDVLLVTENLTLAIQDLRGVPLMTGLQPVAKLSVGLPTMLFVASDFPAPNWEAFIAQARQKRLRAASSGRTGELSFPLALLERRWAIRFQDVVVTDQSRIVEAVASGTADFGIVTADQLAASDARRGGSPQLRPLLGFAAARSPLYPDTPLLGELARDRSLAFTLSFGLFAPLGVSPDVLEQVVQAMLAANDDPVIRQAAAVARFPFAASGAQVLRDTLARDRRTAAALWTALGAPR